MDGVPAPEVPLRVEVDEEEGTAAGVPLRVEVDEEEGTAAGVDGV